MARREDPQLSIYGMSSISNVSFGQLTGNVLQAWQPGHESYNLLQQRTYNKILKHELCWNRFLGQMNFCETPMSLLVTANIYSTNLIHLEVFN